MSSHLAIAVVGAVVIIDNLLAVNSVQLKVILRNQALHLVGIFNTIGRSLSYPNRYVIQSYIRSIPRITQRCYILGAIKRLLRWHFWMNASKQSARKKEQCLPPGDRPPQSLLWLLLSPGSLSASPAGCSGFSVL